MKSTVDYKGVTMMDDISMFLDLVKNKKDLDRYIQIAIENQQWIADIWLDRDFDDAIDYQRDNYEIIKADKITQETIDCRGWNLMAKYQTKDGRYIFIDMNKARMLVAMDTLEVWNFSLAHNVSTEIKEEAASRYMHDFYCVWEMTTDKRYYFKTIDQAEQFHHFLLNEETYLSPHIFGQHFYQNELTAIQHFRAVRKATIGFFHRPAKEEKIYIYFVKDMHGEIAAHFMKESEAREFVKYLNTKRDKMENKDELMQVTYCKVPLSSSVREVIDFYEKKEEYKNE